jgi:hypothetical protein
MPLLEILIVLGLVLRTRRSAQGLTTRSGPMREGTPSNDRRPERAVAALHRERICWRP